MNDGAPVPPGLGWSPSGTVSYAGAALSLRREVEQALDVLATASGATDELYPVLHDAEALQRCRWLDSFPHLTMWAVGPAGEHAAVLAPSACHPVYAARAGQDLPGLTVVHVRSSVCRYEEHMEPLLRQRVFTMDELVALGDPESVQAWLNVAQSRITDVLTTWGISVAWLQATDPFFATTDPRALIQRVLPLKLEATAEHGLAIASANLHHDHFGAAHGITVAGAAAHTACLAVGVDRVVGALWRVRSRPGERA